jgi:tetratricopeptide (TPR) repeat protein
MLGWISLYQKDYKQAMHYLNKTLEMDPNFVPALWYVGRVYAIKGMYEEAIESLKKASKFTFHGPQLFLVTHMEFQARKSKQKAY